jgi:hypothetical protein
VFVRLDEPFRAAPNAGRQREARTRLSATGGRCPPAPRHRAPGREIGSYVRQVRSVGGSFKCDRERSTAARAMASRSPLKSASRYRAAWAWNAGWMRPSRRAAAAGTSPSRPNATPAFKSSPVAATNRSASWPSPCACRRATTAVTAPSARPCHRGLERCLVVGELDERRPAGRPLVPLEDEVVPLAPEMLLADVQIRTLAPRRRLELHVDEPPAVIVDPQTRSALLPQAKRPQRRTRRQRDDASMGPSSHGDIMPGIQHVRIGSSVSIAGLRPP